MDSKTITTKINDLIDTSPSVLRIGSIIFPLRIVTSILWPLIFFGGIGITLFCSGVINITGIDKPTTHAEIYVGTALGIVLIFTGVFLWIIYRLCRLVRNRNYFVLETVELLQEIKDNFNSI